MLNEFKYLYETHLHTSESSACGHDTAEDMVKACKEYGYTGIFVTDHAWGGNTAVDRSLPWREWVRLFALGYEHAREIGDKIGLDVWFGYESGYNGTEFLIYGITPEWMADHSELHDAPISEQIKIIHSGGGIVVQAHPYREEDYIPQIRVFPEYSDAIEGINATHTSPISKAHKSDVWNEQAIKLAQDNNKPITAGSDIHSTTLFGGGIMTKRKLNGPKDYIDLIMGDEMYLITDGVIVLDRYGNQIQGV
ncbi:MAG: PHP domain-containing protein [Lachnospiraceae bacterium]|nr:PHP domain-containing protein [Lachnospiraceae bacterium]